MIRTRATALFFTTALMTGAAFAQTSPTPATDPASPAPATSSMPTGATTAPAGSMSGAAQFVTDQKAGEFRASKFVGLDILGSDGQKIGDINEILIDGTGNAKAIVVGVGGFLGIGEKSVAVPFSAVEWMNARAATTASVSTAPAATGMSGARPSDVTGSTTAAPAARSPAEMAAYNAYPDHGVIKMSKADLQNAPAFKYYAETNARSAAPSNATMSPMTPVAPRQ